MKKRWSVLVSGGVLAASVLGFQGAASAASTGSITIKSHPTGCSYEKVSYDDHRGAEAECTKSNGGHYKAIVVCVRYINGDKVSREAGVRKASGPSIVWCPPETFPETPGIVTKAS